MYIYILYAFLLLSGLGVIIGLLLAWASKVFYVKEDARIKDVEKMLPNYNCGACGYAGCHEMAERLVNGDEKKVGKCKAGKKEKTYDPIIEYLKAHPGDDGKSNIPEI